MNMYGPGGYIMTLNTNMDRAMEDVKELQENNWLDTLTRAIIVEFTVFNPNVNLFSVVSLVVEFNAQGDGHPFEQVSTTSSFFFSLPLLQKNRWKKIARNLFIACNLTRNVLTGMNLEKILITYDIHFWQILQHSCKICVFAQLRRFER